MLRTLRLRQKNGFLIKKRVLLKFNYQTVTMKIYARIEKPNRNIGSNFFCLHQNVIPN